MANWELLQCKVGDNDRQAQCPYCEQIVHYAFGASSYPPEKCPSCGKHLEYIKECYLEKGVKCSKRGSCYGCDLFQENIWEREEDR